MEDDVDDYFDDFDDDIPLPIEESPDNLKKSKNDNLIEDMMGSSKVDKSKKNKM